MALSVRAKEGFHSLRNLQFHEKLRPLPVACSNLKRFLDRTTWHSPWKKSAVLLLKLRITWTKPPSPIHLYVIRPQFSIALIEKKTGWISYIIGTNFIEAKFIQCTPPPPHALPYPAEKSGSAIMSNFGRGKLMLKYFSKWVKTLGPTSLENSNCSIASGLAQTLKMGVLRLRFDSANAKSVTAKATR